MAVDHFEVGDLVEKKQGYRWPGEVRAVFTNRAGETRIVVECTVAEVAGALHIYSPEQIVKVDTALDLDVPPPQSKLFRCESEE